VIERAANVILELFGRYRVHATFFVLGSVAERFPEVCRAIIAKGHEIASHGYQHLSVASFNEESFEQDLRLTSNIIGEVSGKRPRGYRAPFATVPAAADWYANVLIRTGHLYENSRYPRSIFVLSGYQNVSHEPTQLENGLWQIPLSVYKGIPMSGGFYIKTIPSVVHHQLIKMSNARTRSVIIYFHPWDIITDFPCPASSLKERLIYYKDDRVLSKIESLLGKFSFVSMEEWLALKGIGLVLFFICLFWS